MEFSMYIIISSLVVIFAVAGIVSAESGYHDNMSDFIDKDK